VPATDEIEIEDVAAVQLALNGPEQNCECSLKLNNIKTKKIKLLNFKYIDLNITKKGVKPLFFIKKKKN
jgi:hypothetical protein